MVIASVCLASTLADLRTSSDLCCYLSLPNSSLRLSPSPFLAIARSQQSHRNRTFAASPSLRNPLASRPSHLASSLWLPRTRLSSASLSICLARPRSRDRESCENCECRDAWPQPTRALNAPLKAFMKLYERIEISSCSLTTPLARLKRQDREPPPRYKSSPRQLGPVQLCTARAVSQLTYTSFQF